MFGGGHGPVKGFSSIIRTRQTLMRNPFETFISVVEAVIGRSGKPEDMVLAIEPLIRRLVTESGWLEARYRRPIRRRRS